LGINIVYSIDENTNSAKPMRLFVLFYDIFQLHIFGFHVARLF